MSYHKVIYEKLFPYAPYLNERIGIEIIVEDGQSPEEALTEAKRVVDDFYLKNAPQVITGVTEVADNRTIPNVPLDKGPVTKLSKEDQQKQYLLDCKDIPELETFKLLVKKHEYLQETFDNKLKELQSL